MVCYQAIRSSDQLWNASGFIFGNFHQNDVRFSEQSRGFQCTCNALCMLSYSLWHDVDNDLILDEVLCEGDALYQTVISKLKSDGKFMNQLLSLEEIPDDFEVKIGKFTLEKYLLHVALLLILKILACQHFMMPCNQHFCQYHLVLSLLEQYVLLFLKRMSCMHFLILIAMEKMGFHQVMVHLVY